MGVAETASLGAEFIAHYGVKGMKWGVRNDKRGRDRWDPKGHTTKEDVAKALLLPFGTGTPAQVRVIRRIHARNERLRAENRAEKAGKKADKQDKKFTKKAASLDNFIKIHNGCADEFNSKIGGINKKYEKWDLTTHANRAKRDAYDREVEDMMRTAYTNSARRIKSKSGRLSLDVKFQGNGVDFAITTRQLQHADGDAVEFKGKLKRDKMGKIIGFVFDDFVEHDFAEIGAEFIMHYGVKGMRWGQRKDRNAPGWSERARDKQEVKVRAKRPAVTPRVQDSIGTSTRQKTKILSKGGQDHPAAEDALKVAAVRQKLKKSGYNALSNDELRDLATRANLEVQVKQLESKRPKTLGKQVTEALLADPVKTFDTGSKVVRGVNAGLKVAKAAT